MPCSRTSVAVLLCLALVAGCRTPSAPPPEWPVLDTGLRPDENARPPDWYRPSSEPEPWPLGPEPEYATREWRQWAAVKYNSRGVVRRFGEKPVIDGDIEDTVWKGPGLREAFVDPQGGFASPGTIVRFGYDNERLYVAVRAEEPSPRNIRAEIRERDAVLAADDRVEIVLVPGWTADLPDEYQIAINPRGSVTDSRNGDPSWNPELEAAAHIRGDFWAAEVALPLASLGIKPGDLPGKVWGCRVVRLRQAGGAPEVSSWTRILDLSERRINYGHVIFESAKSDAPETEQPKEADAERDRDAEEPKEKDGN